MAEVAVKLGANTPDRAVQGQPHELASPCAWQASCRRTRADEVLQPLQLPAPARLQLEGANTEAPPAEMAETGQSASDVASSLAHAKPINLCRLSVNTRAAFLLMLFVCILSPAVPQIDDSLQLAQQTTCGHCWSRAKSATVSRNCQKMRKQMPKLLGQ